MTDPKALEELDLASRAIGRARALLAREGNGSGAGASPLPLLPCPFCGGHEHLYLATEKTPSKDREVPFYVCGQCAAEGAKPLGSWKLGEDKREEMLFSAAHAWNRRAVRDAPYGKCVICGEPMPKGEETFKFHGYSGDCPKPPLSRAAVRDVTLREALEEIRSVVVGLPRSATANQIYEISDAALSPLSPPEGGKP